MPWTRNAFRGVRAYVVVATSLFPPQFTTLVHAVKANVASATNTDAASKASTFGPANCVSVFRNGNTKTCVVKTDCAESVSLDQVEFSFACRTPGLLQKHSFGYGGFDPKEEFDTGVKCDECGLPEDMVPKSASSFLKQKADAITSNVTKAIKEKHANMVSYGPDDCVATWLKRDNTSDNQNTNGKDTSTTSADGEAGVCQVATKCTKIADDVFRVYPIGVICVNKDSVPVRHMFGSNSFEKTEVFDTMIRCSSCLGLDETSESVTLAETVTALSKQVADLRDDVRKLETEVHGQDSTGAETNSETTATSTTTTSTVVTTTTTTTTTTAAPKAEESPDGDDDEDAETASGDSDTSETSDDSNSDGNAADSTDDNSKTESTESTEAQIKLHNSHSRKRMKHPKHTPRLKKAHKVQKVQKVEVDDEDSDDQSDQSDETVDVNALANDDESDTSNVWND